MLRPPVKQMSAMEMRTRPIAETPDARLVASVLGGDLAAYGHLVRRHAPIAKRMAVLWGAADEADDVVQAVLYLLDAGYVTGETIIVDGGRHVRH